LRTISGCRANTSGSFQAAGLITDAELFLRELVEALSYSTDV